MDIIDSRETTEAEVVVVAIIRPEEMTPVVGVVSRGTGLENVRTDRSWNSQQHPELRQRPRLWTTSQSVAGSELNIGTSPSAVC